MTSPGGAQLLQLAAADYPDGLRRFLGDEAPASVLAVGDPGILTRRLLAFFCSVRCPGMPIVQTYDLARALRDSGVMVIGGFHSPMEKECLAVLLRGSQPVVICPARSIEGMRLPVDWKNALGQRRLLVVSPFEEKHRRVTAELAQRRNRFVAALADQVFISHAEAGGKMMALAEEVVAWGKPVFTFEGEENRALLEVGAKGVRVSAAGSANPFELDHPAI